MKFLVDAQLSGSLELYPGLAGEVHRPMKISNINLP
jgi:hypothetical protein